MVKEFARDALQSLRFVSTRFLLLWSLATVSPALAEDAALIRVGDIWRFLPGTVTRFEERWRELSYDDTAPVASEQALTGGWWFGPSGFVSAGQYEATVMTNMFGGSPSISFRKKFEVSNPASVKWLVLRIDYNDGFVAYLNGTEIARRGLAGPPGIPPSFDAPATVHPIGATEDIDVSQFAGLLKQGENLLAIQGHNANPFDGSFLLVPELLANFGRGPFIQNSSKYSVQIVYRTPVPADTVIEFGLSADLGATQASPNLVMTHVETLTNLEPDSIYFYRVRSSAAGLTALSEISSFRTFKTSGPVSFGVFGDSGSGGVGQYEIAEVIRRLSPDLVMHVGDVAYPAFHQGVADTKCLSVYRPHMQQVPYFFAMGNHDMVPGPADYLEAFYLPTNNVSLAIHAQAGTSPEHYYSFDHGDAHFTVLFVPFLHQYELKMSDPQYQWFTNDLASSKRKWKFLFFHHPSRTSGPHGFDDHNGNRLFDQTDVYNVVMPAAIKYGVQLIFSGHEHAFERFAPMDGVYSVITGGGGIYLYSLSRRQPGSSQFCRRHHCLKVTIQEDVLDLKAVDRTGAVFDSMSIRLAPSPARVWSSSWHTPAQPKTDRSNDNDGNREGQIFDFIGDPVPAVTGQFSNLGQIYVNNDSTNLYIGFYQTMFYSDNDLFLFIESPRLNGVTNMVGLGNGNVDPEGQGADGLDFLKNLSFTNFSPVVACILGDEFADGQFRSFRRLGAEFNSGQGIFHLDSVLSDFADGRIQQFNRSPQAEAGPEESNADLIIVTLPFQGLGGLQEGDVIKLAALVAGNQVNTDREAQSRQLDVGYLGESLTLTPPRKAILQGIRVQLAHDPTATLRLSLVVTGTLARIDWNVVPGKKYLLESAEKVTGPFTNIALALFPQAASSNTQHYIEPLAGSARFYRIRLVP